MTIFRFSCCVVVTKLRNWSSSSILLIWHSDNSDEDDDDDEDEEEVEEEEDEDESDINMSSLPSPIPSMYCGYRSATVMDSYNAIV